MHGAAAKESFVNDFNNAIAEFVTTKDVAATMTKFAEAAKSAGYK